MPIFGNKLLNAWFLPAVASFIFSLANFTEAFFYNAMEMLSSSVSGFSSAKTKSGKINKTMKIIFLIGVSPFFQLLQ